MTQMDTKKLFSLQFWPVLVFGIPPPKAWQPCSRLSRLTARKYSTQLGLKVCKTKHRLQCGQEDVPHKELLGLLIFDRVAFRSAFEINETKEVHVGNNGGHSLYSQLQQVP